MQNIISQPYVVCYYVIDELNDFAVLLCPNKCPYTGCLPHRLGLN